MKKLLTILLVFVMIFTVAACGPSTPAPTDPEKTEGPVSSEPGGEEPGGEDPSDVVDPHDWAAYDALIKEIKSTTDLKARVDLMHKAEDMLMETGAIVPIYHYNDNFMAKSDLKGYYVTPYAYKYFEKATYGDKSTLNLCIASEPQYIDPALNTAVDGAVLAVNSFSGLVTYNENMELVPDTAE
ncbi:MAG: hypothetical protein PHG57_03335 [Eubacteriales bacterium]|nr:hypothetical protein [Eubacteriales bacterium]